MRRYALFDLLRRTRDVHIHLLERTNLIVTSIRQILHRTHHSRSGGEQKKTRVLSAFGLWNVTDLQIKRNVVLALGLPYAQVDSELLSNWRSSPTDYATVKLNTEIIFTVN